MMMERALGALFGFHVGELFGAGFDSRLPESDRSRWIRGISGGGPSGMAVVAAGPVTNRMASVLGTVASGGFNSEQIAKDLSAAGLADDARGAAEGSGDPSGSLIRCLALAFLPWKTPVDLWVAVGKLAAITHQDSLCAQVDFIYLTLIRDLIEGTQKRHALARMQVVADKVSPEIGERLCTASSLGWGDVPTSGNSLDTLVAALWAFTNHTGFEDGIVALGNRGGSAGVTCAVAGAIMAAFAGTLSIPCEWFWLAGRRLEIRDEYMKLNARNGVVWQILGTSPTMQRGVAREKHDI